MKVKKKKKKLKVLKTLSQQHAKTKANIKATNNNSKNKNNKKKKKNNKKKTANKKKKKVKRKLWKKLVTAILILGIMAVLAVAVFIGYVVVSSPKFDTEAFKVNDQTVVYDIDNQIIATLGTQKRESVTYDELPQVLIDAIVATEDSKFFQHNGVDLLRFTKATIQQLLGQDAGGASTLTMQVAKNNLTQQGKLEKNILEKIVRKFHDVYLAVFKIEKKYSKEKIFEFYVNSYYLGGSSYGVQAASKYYFDKDVSEITLPEAALIAGLFQSPGLDNPYKDIEAATKRREIVLKLMERHEYITKEEADYARSISIESLLTEPKEEGNYQGYIDTVVDEVQELTGFNPYTTPMKIYTTMERSIQSGIDAILSGETSYKWENKNVQAGIAIINSKTGAIAAVGAGRNRTGVNTFNYATQAYRQPGSTAKPIFAYGPAIENNKLSTYSLFYDEKWGYTNGPNVNNWDGKYKELVTLRYALQYSRNVPAIKAYQLTGTKNVHKFAYSLGLDVALNTTSENYKVLGKGVDNTVNEAYAIGGVAKGFTPLNMAAAYAAFSNGGFYTEPYTVTKIEFRTTGEIKEYKYKKTRVMKDSTAYMMNNVLESAVKSGFSGGANVSGSHVAAKTGTSNFPDSVMKQHKLPSSAVNDLWTVAYTSKYSVAVWYGYKEVTSKTYNTSGTPKDKLTAAVMKYIPKDTKGWTKPSSVVTSQVEVGTWPAMKPSQNTPASLIKTEYFLRGTEPTETSNRFDQLNDVKNINTTTLGNAVTITWEHDTPTIFTDDYLNKYYSQSVFGNGTEKLITSMKEYKLPGVYVSGSKKIAFSYGKLGYGIYKKEADETLTLIGFTTDKTYTYNIYADTTIVIKAEYESFKTNASPGISVELKSNYKPEPIKTLTMILDKKDVTTTVGNYTDYTIKSLYYGLYDVKNTATIKYQLINNTAIIDCETIDKLKEEVNKLPIGTYQVKFIANYLGQEATETQNLIIK
ncbi:MAG: transglycosylase domain-containing protein [Bacilli bacterium]|nr:transglycosylase domain-containing protein [Bacilli bacterium]